MKNSCEISSLDLSTAPKHAGESTEQFVLRLIKDKGAPVVGMILLKADPDYVFNRRYSRSRDTYIFSWKKLK